MESKYQHSEKIHRSNDAKIITKIICELFNPKSVIDIGCGLGNFLAEFEHVGISEIKGVEGPWIKNSNVKISRDKILIHDLNQTLNLNQNFDVAICLEVAEHLDKKSSDNIVSTLINCSDLIVFSAAIPNQGGQNHVNEQWLSFWIEQFEKHNYFPHDIIRSKIWKNEEVYWWYKQNIIVFKKNIKPNDEQILNVVHPELWFERTQLLDEILHSKKSFNFYMKLILKKIYNLFAR